MREKTIDDLLAQARSLRLKKHLTTKDIADIRGLKRNTISEIEAGRDGTIRKAQAYLDTIRKAPAKKFYYARCRAAEIYNREHPVDDIEPEYLLALLRVLTDSRLFRKVTNIRPATRRGLI